MEGRSCRDLNLLFSLGIGDAIRLLLPRQSESSLKQDPSYVLA